MLVSLSTLLRGSTYEKLKWTFTLYDLNGDGFITRQEVYNVMLAVHELMGLHGSPVVRYSTLTFLFTQGWLIFRETWGHSMDLPIEFGVIYVSRQLRPLGEIARARLACIAWIGSKLQTLWSSPYYDLWCHCEIQNRQNKCKNWEKLPNKNIVCWAVFTKSPNFTFWHWKTHIW